MEIKKQNSPEKQQVEKLMLHDKELDNGNIVMSNDGNLFIVEIEGDNVVEYYRNPDGSKGRHYGTSTIKEMTYHRYIKIDNLDEIEQEVSDIMSGKKQIEEAPKIDQQNDNTDIVPTNGKVTLEALQIGLQSKIAQFEAVSRLLQNKLEGYRHQMLSLLDSHRYQLEKVQKAIRTIELYLGINEDIIQLQEGTNADGPLYLRQQILFMDEEVGITENNGIDFTNIEKFDKWIQAPENLNRLIPETKCIVVFRVRRHKKEYYDPYDNALMNQENRKTYFLLRNGTNLYRIWGDLIIYPRVFPGKNEMNLLYEEYQKSTWKDRDFKKFEQALNDYKKHLIVLQGLIDRTEVFNPIKKGINLFTPETYTDEDIRLIYDGEMLLPDGRKTFNEWRKEINNKITRGSRIVWIRTAEHSRNDGGRYWSSRFTKYYRYFPGAPSTGLYTVEDEVEGRGIYSESYTLKFLFSLKDSSYRERKNRISWLFSKDEHEVLNYDMISLEDIEFYLNSRADRPNYLDMLPILKFLKKQRLEEIEWEKSFVKMMIGELLPQVKIDIDSLEKIIWEAIDWWKYKVIWKRPITKDDEKALRMIKSKVLNLLKK